MDQSRRTFVRFTVTFLGAAAAGACGTSSPPPPGGSGGGGGVVGGGSGENTCPSNGAIATAISGNHGHSLLVPAGDFTDGGADKSYDIHGTATHTHFVTLTGAQRNTLLSGTPVTVVSTTSEFHHHDVTIACA